MNTEEEIILRKFLGDHKFDKLIMNESLWLVCQAMKAYKNIPKLVKNLSLSGASKSVVCGNCDGYGYTVDENGRRKEHCNECEQQQIIKGNIEGVPTHQWNDISYKKPRKKYGLVKMTTLYELEMKLSK